MTTTPTSIADEQRPVGGQRARAGPDRLLRASEPARREHGDDRQEPADQHGQRRGVVL